MYTSRRGSNVGLSGDKRVAKHCAIRTPYTDFYELIPETLVHVLEILEIHVLCLVGYVLKSCNKLIEKYLVYIYATSVLYNTYYTCTW